jgi:meiotically up-regulated gene 157 (Mug157) protein
LSLSLFWKEREEEIAQLFFLFIEGEPDTFIITGDIFALWLRDSTNQVLPYIPFATKDPNLQNMIKGLINRHVKLFHFEHVLR